MQPQTTPVRNAEPLKRAACVVLYVRFVDNNMRPFYSRDIEFKPSDYRYHNEGYWTQRFKLMVKDESPAGWKGRVQEAAIFHSFDGNKGDKICQFNKLTGGWDK